MSLSLSLLCASTLLKEIPVVETEVHLAEQCLCLSVSVSVSVPLSLCLSSSLSISVLRSLFSSLSLFNLLKDFSVIEIK